MTTTTASANISAQDPIASSAEVPGRNGLVPRDGGHDPIADEGVPAENGPPEWAGPFTTFTEWAGAIDETISADL